MSVFDQFVSLHAGQRMAAQYNGHLWHILREQTQARMDLDQYDRFALLRELRERVLDKVNAEQSINELIAEVLTEVDRHRPKIHAGCLCRVMECPWCSAHDESCPGSKNRKRRIRPRPDDPAQDCRGGFRRGLKAMADLLEMIRADEIVETQVRRYYNRTSATADERPDAESVAKSLLKHIAFTEGCLSPATFSAIDFVLLVLAANHDDTSCIDLDEIIRIIRYGKGPNGQSLGGRYGSIANRILERLLGRPGRQHPQGDGNNPNNIRVVSRSDVDQPTTDSGLKDYQSRQLIEDLISRSKPEHQPILGQFINCVVDDGANLTQVCKHLATRFGITASRAREICMEFAKRLRDEG